MKTFRDYQLNHTYLLPPSLLDWLPKDHLVHFISEVVQTLDLSAIYDSYAETRGQLPYHPEMMVKVWPYAYPVGFRSSRKVERALHENVGFRVLSGDQQPKYWALNNSEPNRTVTKLLLRSSCPSVQILAFERSARGARCFPRVLRSLTLVVVMACL